MYNQEFADLVIHRLWLETFRDELGWTGDGIDDRINKTTDMINAMVKENPELALQLKPKAATINPNDK